VTVEVQEERKYKYVRQERKGREYGREKRETQVLTGWRTVSSRAPWLAVPSRAIQCD